MSARNVLKGGFAIALLLVSLPVAAQELQRGYVVGMGGVGATEVTSPFFGGAVGVNVTPDLIVTGEMSRSQDVLANFTKEDLAYLDQTTTAETGLPFSSKVKMPTNFYTAGVRYLLPVSWMARPYVSGAGGVANMRPEPTFTLLGIDITSEMLAEPDIQKAVKHETRPMASVGGGVNVTVAKHVTLDVGYVFTGIFINRDYLQESPNDVPPPTHTHNRLYTHRAYAGAGFRF